LIPFSRAYEILGSLIVYCAEPLSGLPPITENVKIKEYFPELDINFEDNFLDQDISYCLI
jgi:hypothetical protein